MIEQLKPVVGFSTERRDKRILSHAGLNPAQLGRAIGSGVEHHVYDWMTDTAGTLSVVKIPTLSKQMMRLSTETDLELVNTFMPGIVPETSVIGAGRGAEVIVQEKMTGGVPLIADPHFVELLTELAEQNRKLFAETGASLDLYRIGLVLLGKRQNPEASNFMRGGPDQNIQLTDFSLIHTNPTDYLGHRSPLSTAEAAVLPRILTRIVQSQASAIERHLGIQII